MADVTEPQQAVQAYLQVFDRRDLPGCMEFFADDAAINFITGVYRGRRAIEEWHRDRFAADVHVTRLEEVRAKGDQVSVDAVVTSKVLKMWRFNSVAGTATFTFREGKIKDAKFGLRAAIPFEGW